MAKEVKETKKVTKKVKEYTLECKEQPFKFIGELGIQFRKGEFKTTDETLVDKILKYEGIYKK